MATAEQRVVEAEHGHDRLGGCERRVQGGMVMDLEVAAEPDDRDHAAGGLPYALRTSLSAGSIAGWRNWSPSSPRRAGIAR